MSVNLSMRFLEPLYKRADEDAEALNITIYDAHASVLHSPKEFFPPVRQRRLHGKEEAKAGGKGSV